MTPANNGQFNSLTELADRCSELQAAMQRVEDLLRSLQWNCAEEERQLRFLRGQYEDALLTFLRQAIVDHEHMSNLQTALSSLNEFARAHKDDH